MSIAEPGSLKVTPVASRFRRGHNRRRTVAADVSGIRDFREDDIERC
ncbi:hypothetical protein Ait01nite_078910 [Actinoplanes italicus]|uniref:Uncharacterized protein n=1 Tax=Actinoplanes italicus TaxID=113567 RepID=A0A2T0JNH7_9ACTN|nr:hypothetical protein [Actinoplanes italicus]PRX09161.1 hypothetical protein CLV67_13726 [Actinoplanes italicus]GIE34846.1 hypothetical protein Ait01nite_078910 [Actinoplanes italicus]